MSEPYDMILAIREAGFRDKEESYEWMMTPNTDIGGLRPAEAANRGLYGAVAKAARLRGQRLQQPTFRTIDDPHDSESIDAP